MFVSYFFKSLYMSNKKILFLSFLFCILCGLSRVESRLYCWIFSVFYFVLYIKNSGTDILSPDKMIFLNCVFLFSQIIFTKRLLNTILKFELFFVFFTFFSLFIIYFLYSDHIYKSICSILLNLISENWKLSFIFFLFFYVISMTARTIYLEREISLSFLGCFFSCCVVSFIQNTILRDFVGFT